ncbi:hypothetical protein B0H19DRAFT_1247304 [Mycena capillaripes]|nr:hypothetical protein B0H19DRAFT_1247304 [Mycena capillaripes]
MSHDGEIVDIKALLVEPTLRLKRLDEEIADLQKAINKLAAELREVLGALVEGHKALISPVHRLPLDILQEIFVTCIPTHRNCVVSSSEAPVLLGRICSSWRAISLSTPRLWARLHIVEPPLSYGPAAELHNQKVAQRLGITKTWLSRSGQCPFSISLQSGPNYESPSASPSNAAPHSRRFLQTLVAFAARWQHIHFSFTTPPSMLDDISQLMATAVPMLESVVFHLQQIFPLLPVKWELFEMLRSPSISSFSTSGNSFMPKQIPICWYKLTDLTVDGPAWETLLTSEMALQTFSRCPELCSCKLVINDGVDVETLLHSAAELRYLHTLDLDFGSVISRVPRFLERLSLPELRTFTLHGYADQENSLSLAPFFTLWTRLESLSILHLIRFRNLRYSKASEIYLPLCGGSASTSLTECQAAGSEFGSLDDEGLANLTPLCPDLRHVSSEVHHSKDDGPGGGSYDDDILPNLEPFIQTGLDVSITYFPLQTTTPFSPWQGLADAPAMQLGNRGKPEDDEDDTPPRDRFYDRFETISHFLSARKPPPSMLLYRIDDEEAITLPSATTRHTHLLLPHVAAVVLAFTVPAVILTVRDLSSLVSLITLTVHAVCAMDRPPLLDALPAASNT